MLSLFLRLFEGICGKAPQSPHEPSPQVLFPSLKAAATVRAAKTSAENLSIVFASELSEAEGTVSLSARARVPGKREPLGVPTESHEEPKLLTPKG